MFLMALEQKSKTIKMDFVFFLRHVDELFKLLGHLNF